MDSNGKGTMKVQVEPVHLGYFTVKTSRIRISSKQAIPALSPSDQSRWAELTSEVRRQQFLAARSALEAIQPESLAQLTYPEGAPTLPSGYVSFSHGGAHAVAVHHPYLAVGVDIEGPRPQLERIARKFLHSEELSFLDGHPEREWLLRVAWGAKEAVYKAAQVKGLAFAEEIRFTQWPDENGTFSISVPGNGERSDAHFILRAKAVEVSENHSDCLVTAIQVPQPLHVVVTGPESCGKSTLADGLQKTLGYPMVEEMARHYMESIQRAATADDLLAILDLQQQAQKDTLLPRHSFGEKSQKKSPAEVVIHDTDEQTLLLWMEEKFGPAPQKLQDAADQPLAHLYLLCGAEIPWQPDPLRENPYDRDRLYTWFRKRLETLGRPFVVVSGSEGVRLEKAQQAIAMALGHSVK